MVPSSSAHWAVGRTTSASSAVSDKKMSDTTSRSRAARRERTRLTSGADTDEVGRHQQQRPDSAVGSHPIEQLVRGQAGLRQLGRIDSPDACHVGTIGRIGQLAVAGQLVGLLPVLATALAVPLPGDGAVAGEGSARQPQRQRQVDEGLGGVGAAAVLLSTASGQDHRGVGLSQGVHGVDHGLHRHAGDPLHPIRPVGRDTGLDRREAAGASGHVRLVDQPFLDHQVQQTVGQCQVCAGHRLQVQARSLGGGGTARVNHDVGGTGCSPGVEVLHGRRHGGRRVGADEQDRPGLGQVRQGKGKSAVDAEGTVARGGGRAHAEPAVVVDHGGAQRDPGELAERVRLLVGQPATTEAADRVVAVPLLGGEDAAGDRVQCLVPGRRAQRAGPITGNGAQHRLQQSVRVVEQGGGAPALAAQPAAVGRELLLRTQRRRPPACGQHDAALQGAVRAVRPGVGWRHVAIVEVACYSAERSRVTTGYRSLTPSRTAT